MDRQRVFLVLADHGSASWLADRDRLRRALVAAGIAADDLLTVQLLGSPGRQLLPPTAQYADALDHLPPQVADPGPPAVADPARVAADLRTATAYLDADGVEPVLVLVPVGDVRWDDLLPGLAMPLEAVHPVDPVRASVRTTAGRAGAARRRPETAGRRRTAATVVVSAIQALLGAALVLAGTVGASGLPVVGLPALYERGVLDLLGPRFGLLPGLVVGVGVVAAAVVQVRAVRRRTLVRGTLLCLALALATAAAGYLPAGSVRAVEVLLQYRDPGAPPGYWDHQHWTVWTWTFYVALLTGVVTGFDTARRWADDRAATVRLPVVLLLIVTSLYVIVFAIDHHFVVWW